MRKCNTNRKGVLSVSKLFITSYDTEIGKQSKHKDTLKECFLLSQCILNSV